MIATDFSGTLRKILRRLKLDKLGQVLGEWGAIDNETVTEILQHEDLKTKKEVIEKLIDECKEQRLTKKNVAELDLIYNYHNSGSKKWSVFQLSGSKGQQKVVHPKEFGKILNEQLKFYFKCDVCVKKVGDALWLRIGIQEGSSTQIWLPSNVIYMVHHLQSQYIIISKFKVSHRDYLLQSLLVALQCAEIKELQLSGYNVASLADLVLYQNSQGRFAQYRFNQVHTNPLSKRTSRKRKASSELDLEAVAVTYENVKDRENQEKLTEDIFGKHKQPKLQKLHYKLETRFRGKTCPAAMTSSDDPFFCEVKFEGPSVLEGIKGLSNRGMAAYPLPHHLGNVHSLAKNQFVLADKSRASPNDSRTNNTGSSSRFRTPPNS